MKWTRYAGIDTASIPARWGEERPDIDDIMGAGLEPDDEMLQVGRLTAEWNGHPAGSLVLAEVDVEGAPIRIGTP